MCRLPIAGLILALALAATARAAAAPPAPQDVVKVSVEAVPPRVAPGGRTVVRVVIEIAEGWHVLGTQKQGVGLPTVVGLDPPAPAWISGWSVRPPPTVREDLFGETLDIYEGTATFECDLTLASDAPAGEAPFAVLVTYQACSDEACLPEVQKRVEGGITVTGAGVAGRFAGVLAAGGVFWALLTAFGWGVASCLTPCVYPMIPITVAFFGGGKSRGRVAQIALSLVFVLGIALTFGAAGVALTATTRDLGSLMADPRVVWPVVAVLWAFALAMLGVWEVQAPRFLLDRLGGSAPGVLGAFAMGATLGVVAAPCVGPFAGALLAWVASTGSLFLGFWALFAYGLGLGSIFVLVAMGVTFLPRSGAWMVRLKVFFGLVLSWMTLYFIQFVATPGWVLAIAGVYAILTGAFIGAFRRVEGDEPGPILAKALGVAALAGGVTLMALGMTGIVGATIPGVVRVAPPTGVGVAWEHDFDRAIERALAERRPLFADFYADWCLPCRRMDSTVFGDPEVAREATRFVAVRVDCSQKDGPNTRMRVERFGSYNMPYIVFMDSAGVFKPELAFEGYTDRDAFLARLRELR